MTAAAIYAGIDVAMAYLDLAMRPAGTHERLPHDEAGVAQIVERLGTLRPMLVVLEATGGLEVPRVAALAGAGLAVAVVNPRQVRDFAKAVGQLAKTDALDAHLLARFAAVVRPAPRPLPDADAQALSTLLARRQQVIAMLVAEPQRLPTTLPALRPRLAAHIAWLRQERDDLDHELRRQLRASAAWREDDDLLQRVPGIGPVLATTLIAALPEWGRLNRKRVPARSWGWRRSTARAASCAAGASSGVAAGGCARPSGWGRLSLSNTTRFSAPSPLAWWQRANPRKWR